MKKYRNINKSTLLKGGNKTVTIVTRFDHESLHAVEYAVVSFGEETRYILVCIYFIENVLDTVSAIPAKIRDQMMEKPTQELSTTRSILSEEQPEIAIQFEFGSAKDVSEVGWRNKDFELVVLPNEYSGMLGIGDSLPMRQVPTQITSRLMPMVKSRTSEQAHEV